MAHNLDLTLPATAPADYLSRPRENDILPTALYTLISLTAEELTEVARACQHEELDFDEYAIVRPAPEPHFVSQPLRAVYDSHLQLGEQGEFDPVYFIVVVDKDWKENGVLLVTLENDDEPPAVDSFLCPVEDTGSIVQNLQIANTDWDECKDNYEIGGAGDDDDDDDDEDEDEGEDDKEEQEELPTDAAEGQSDDEGPEYPSRKPAYDYLIPIYTLESVDAEALISSLEEDADEKPNPFTDYQIRNQASLKPTGPSNTDIKTLSKPDPLVAEDLVAQACALHPIRCRANKWLNKTYFLICDNTQPSTSGLLLVKLTWDGVTKGRSKADLRELGVTSPHETTRVAGTRSDAITYSYTMIADGTSVFSRTHPAFAVFQLNADLPHHGVKLVDAKYWDRKSGDKYFIVAWTPVEVHRSSSTPEEINVSWTLEEAVHRFPWFCYANRFEPLFNRQYFVWFDHETVEKEGVTIVRYDWDGDVERGEGELWEMREVEKVRSIKVPAKEAMQRILEAVKDGADEWAWEDYRG